MIDPTVLQKYIDHFRFQIVDEKDVQRSSTWKIIHNKDSVYIFVRVHGGKMKLSFHPIGSADDGNDAQYGLTRTHAQALEAEGHTVFNPLRWKRPNDRDKLNLAAKLLFPTDFMTGEVFQFVNVKTPKVSLPIAPAGHAVEVSIFFHHLDANPVEDVLISKGFTSIFYMTLESGEIATVAARHVPFDRNSLPKVGRYPGMTLSNTQIEDSKYLHGVLFNKPADYECFQLVEVNGFQVED